jgi:hypothetical protein
MLLKDRPRNFSLAHVTVQHAIMPSTFCISQALCAADAATPRAVTIVCCVAHMWCACCRTVRCSCSVPAPLCYTRCCHLALSLSFAVSPVSAVRAPTTVAVRASCHCSPCVVCFLPLHAAAALCHCPCCLLRAVLLSLYHCCAC